MFLVSFFFLRALLLNIHAHLAIKVLELPELALWYYCRGLDTQGSGKLSITRKAIEEGFNITRTTMWRWLNNKALFRHYKYDPKTGAYTIYLTGLVNVCVALNVKNLGGIGESDTVQDLAAQAALIEAQKLQAQSAYLAKLNDSDWTLVKPEAYFDGLGEPLLDISTGSKTARKIKLKEVREFNNRPLMILRNTALTYGASQKGIASRLDISVGTVSKLLRSAQKFQPAVRVSWKYYFRAVFEASENFGNPLESGFFPSKEGPLKLLPYRYYPLYALRSQKKLRGKLNQAFTL